MAIQTKEGLDARDLSSDIESTPNFSFSDLELEWLAFGTYSKYYSKYLF